MFFLNLQINVFNVYDLTSVVRLFCRGKTFYQQSHQQHAGPIQHIFR